MIKSYEYRIYPTKSQEKDLLQQMETCAELYNFFLNHRKSKYENNKNSVSLFDQHKILTTLKETDSKYTNVHSQVLQNVAVRVDLAFKAFFRRVKNGEKAGYPRYKSKSRYNSITFPQAPSGCQIKGNHLIVSKVGKIKIKQHRDLVGTPKTATVKKSSTGKWYVVFTCEMADLNIQVPQTNTIGIDVGIENFAHFSNNDKIENPKFFKKEEKELAKAQRKLPKQLKGTKERQKARKVVARIHERISFKRKNFAHQQSRKIVDLFNPIFIEDLSINNMRHNSHRCMNKAISDAAWSMFFNFLQYKAEEAGVVCRKMNPAYTSQNCSDCGHRNSLKLSDRLFKCTCCNFETTRDHNAAINIKTLGLQGLANSLEANVL